MATIAEIREKYPQYSDMPDAALADALHSKFYSDMPKSDFYSKIGFSASAPAPTQYGSEVPQLDTQGRLIRQPDAIPSGRPEIPSWGEQNPRAYKFASGALDVAAPTIEGLAAAGGGVVGLAAGGPPGAALGAGVGYGIGKEITTAAEVALGRRAPRTAQETISEPSLNVALGTMGEAAVGPVVRGASKILDIGKINALKAKGIVSETLGGLDIASIRNMLARSGPDVTPAQATEGIGKTAWQALNERVSGRTVSSADFKYITQEAQEAARKAGIKSVTPDLAASIRQREAMSKPFYEAADKAVVTIDDPLRTIFNRLPEGTLNKAAEIAKMEGKPFITNIDTPQGQISEISGESMHYIKRALSDIANAPAAAQGAGRDTQAAARSVLDDFVKAFEARVPAYAEAREIFKDLSKPVNQAKVLDTMMKVLEQPGGGERVLPFLNALGRGETALLKKSTGFPRYETGDLSKVLTPQQMEAVDSAVSQMTRDISISAQASNGREAMRDVLLNNLKLMRLPSFIDLRAAVSNKLLDTIENKVGRAVMDRLTESLKTAKTAEELLSVLPASERIRVIRIVNDVASSVKPSQRAIRTGAGVTAETAISGDNRLFAPRNNLAPEQQNRNSLRP
jgi:hypothetical protein